MKKNIEGLEPEYYITYSPLTKYIILIYGNWQTEFLLVQIPTDESTVSEITWANTGIN